MSNRAVPPWGLQELIGLDPIEYEKQVVRWLRLAGGDISKLSVKHDAKVEGKAGTYSLDGVAEFEAFGGAKFRVLIECKRYSRPIERDTLLSIWAKQQEVKAHKAMVFTTSGFQKGALEFAESKGMATIQFSTGELQYFTRSIGPLVKPPPWANLPTFVGQLISVHGEVMRVQNFEDRDLEVLINWTRG